MVTHLRETLLATGPAHIVSGPDHVRVRIWSDPPITGVRYRVNGRDWMVLSRSSEDEWQGDLSVSGLTLTQT